MFFFIYST